MKITIPEAMDEFHRIVNSTPATEAVARLERTAATMPIDVAISALCRLYVVQAARLRFADVLRGNEGVPV